MIGWIICGVYLVGGIIVFYSIMSQSWQAVKRDPGQIIPGACMAALLWMGFIGAGLYLQHRDRVEEERKNGNKAGMDESREKEE